MKYKYAIVTSIIAMSGLYGMDVKKHHPTMQIITNEQSLITFKKKTKPFNYWMKKRQNTIFGNNRLFEYVDGKKGLVLGDALIIPQDNHIKLAYISNLEKHYLDHQKFVMLGAFLTYDSRILPNNHITLLTNHYAQHIARATRPPKPSPQIGDGTQTPQRGSVIMQNLFELIETHGKPEGLLVVIAEEDLELLHENSPKNHSIEETKPDKQPKRSRHSLSRRPSGRIKLPTRKSTTRKPKDLRDDKTA